MWRQSRILLASSSERPIHLQQRAAAARAGAGGAAEAMVPGHDLAIVDLARIDIPQEKRRASSIARPLHPELLIEIAIVNFPAPTDADGVATHETIDRRGIERVDQ